MTGIRPSTGCICSDARSWVAARPKPAGGISRGGSQITVP
jgi:hypothetical protein